MQDLSRPSRRRWRSESDYAGGRSDPQPHGGRPEEGLAIHGRILSGSPSRVSRQIRRRGFRTRDALSLVFGPCCVGPLIERPPLRSTPFRELRGSGIVRCQTGRRQRANQKQMTGRQRVRLGHHAVARGNHVGEFIDHATGHDEPGIGV